MKDIKVLLSSLLIIVAFFLWYLFKTYQYEDAQDANKNTYVNVETKGKKINLESDNPNIILLLNWEETASGSIILE